MKSIKVTNTGGPEVLKLEDITLEKPGADEVQIKHVLKYSHMLARRLR